MYGRKRDQVQACGFDIHLLDWIVIQDMGMLFAVPWEQFSRGYRPLTPAARDFLRNVKAGMR